MSRKKSPASKPLSRIARLVASSAIEPNVIVPKPISGTRKPVRPSRRRFIADLPWWELGSGRGIEADRDRRAAQQQAVPPVDEPVLRAECGVERRLRRVGRIGARVQALRRARAAGGLPLRPGLAALGHPG